MRRHALLLSIIVLGAVSALATPVRAQAVTRVRSFPQEFVTPICNGDWPRLPMSSPHSTPAG